MNIATRLEIAQEKWETLLRQWMRAIMKKFLIYFSIVCALLTVIGFILTFTICPVDWRPLSVYASFFPILLWTLMAALTLAGARLENVNGGNSCNAAASCFWNFVVRIAFYCRCNQQDFTPSSYPFHNLQDIENELMEDLPTICLPLGNTRKNNIFAVPKHIQQVEKLSIQVSHHKQVLVTQLPLILMELVVVLPRVLHPLIISYLV